MKVAASISIIIPTLNEEVPIQRLLRTIEDRGSVKHIGEILVVDGGSTDATRTIVQEMNLSIPLRLLTSRKGRAVQMNHGAKEATGDILYFLHADTLPPNNFDLNIKQAMQAHEAGCFRLKFDSDHPLLQVLQWFTRFNWRICRGGDQSLFIQKRRYEFLGGFDEAYLVYEDCELINRIYQKMNFIVLPQAVLTSARKYNELGTARLQFHFSMIHLKSWFGAPPTKLVSYYQKHIAS